MDETFDLDLHLRRMRLCPGATFRDVLDLGQVMATVGFDLDLPLWEAVVVERIDGESAAMIIKLHHALVDGVGGLAVLMHLLDRDRDSSFDQDPVPETASHRQNSGLHWSLPSPRKVIEVMLHGSTHPLEQAGQVAATVVSAARLLAPAGRPSSSLMTERGFRRGFEVLDFELQSLRDAATATEATLNDVFVAAVVRGLVIYHEFHDASIGTLRTLMPINVRAAGDPVAGNRFVPARFTVPAPADPTECVRAVQQITASWKHAPGLALNDVLATGLDKLPHPVVMAMWGSMLSGDDFCITNVPGPAFDTYLAGSRVERMYAFAPPSGAALNVSLVTATDRACVGIVIDRAAVPDGAQLASCIAAGFEEVSGLQSAQGGR